MERVQQLRQRSRDLASNVSASSSTFVSSRPCLQKVVDEFRRNSLAYLTILATVIGLIFGLSVGSANPSPTLVMIIAFPGELLLRMFKMLVLPLIISTMISAISQSDARMTGRIGLRAVAFYMTTTILASITGIILVLIIKPGRWNTSDDQPLKPVDSEIRSGDLLMDTLRNFFPENIVQACFEKSSTYYVPSKTEINLINSTGGDIEIDEKSLERKVTYTPGENMCGLIVFCIAIGIIMTRIRSDKTNYQSENVHKVIEFFDILMLVMFKMINFVMMYTPFGIACLIASKVMLYGNVTSMMMAGLLSLISVIIGILIHGCVTLSLIYYFTTRKSPLPVVRGVVQALLTAFGTDSSAATLPTTIECVEKLGINKMITRFTCPIGATINMDGAAISFGTMAVTIAQYRGVALNIGEIITVCVMSALSSVAAAGVPAAGGGFVILSLVLSPIGLPIDDYIIFLPFEWLRGRFSTTVNVLGDCYAAAIVEHRSKAEIESMMQEDAGLEENGKELEEEQQQMEEAL